MATSQEPALPRASRCRLHLNAITRGEVVLAGRLEQLGDFPLRALDAFSSIIKQDDEAALRNGDPLRPRVAVIASMAGYQGSDRQFFMDLPIARMLGELPDEIAEWLLPQPLIQAEIKRQFRAYYRPHEIEPSESTARELRAIIAEAERTVALLQQRKLKEEEDARRARLWARDRALYGGKPSFSRLRDDWV
jgi:hypothetical protein